MKPKRIITAILLAVVAFSALIFLPYYVSLGIFFMICIISIFELFFSINPDDFYEAFSYAILEIMLMLLACFSGFLYGDKFVLGYLIVLCSSVDCAGYLVGNLLGKKAHKVSLLKNISPNKTWEGFIGGIIASITVGLLCFRLFGKYLPEYAEKFAYFGWLPAIAGDLYESKVKRKLNIKDSGASLADFSAFFRTIEAPLASHGGYLDRIDSLVPTITFYAAFAAIIG